MKEFLTHTKEKVSGERLEQALLSVANDWRKLAHAIRKEDAYASHVTEEVKDQSLQKMLAEADRIEHGEISTFTIWQRINEKLTGECVALLPK